MNSMFDGALGHKFSEGTFFLRGDAASRGRDSVEHVIPRWLQKRFSLWDIRVYLLNGTPVQCRNFTKKGSENISA